MTQDKDEVIRTLLAALEEADAALARMLMVPEARRHFTGGMVERIRAALALARGETVAS